jgi:thiaminase
MSIESVGEMFLRFGERFGIPVVLLAIFLWMGREAAISVHRTVVEPVVTSHTKFIDTICDEERAQTRAMEKQAQAFGDLCESHEQQMAILRQAFPNAAEHRTAPVAPQ